MYCYNWSSQVARITLSPTFSHYRLWATVRYMSGWRYISWFGNFMSFFINIIKTIFGSDCVLDLYSVDDICLNLKRFFEWSTDNCRAGEKRIQALEKRCENINRIKRNIQATLSGWSLLHFTVIQFNSLNNKCFINQLWFTILFTVHHFITYSALIQFEGVVDKIPEAD